MFARSRSALATSGVNIRDAAVAVVLLGLMVASIAGKAPDPGQRGGDFLAYVLAVPLTLPFAVHRRWPMSSLIATVAAFSFFAVASYAAYPGVSLFAILFGIAAHTDRRQSRLALGVCVVALVTGLATQPAHVVRSADWTSSMLAIAVAWLAGENHRARRARWAALEERATMVEHEQRERERRVVADERLRIARDLHDIVAHAMSVIAVQAGTGHHLLDRDPEAARRALANVETASRGALVEMRRMLGVLRDDDDAPGSRAPAPGLPASIDLALYRVVQESLTNVMKHGGPMAFVKVSSTATDLHIEVTDDGRAVAPTATERSTPGQGLIGMRERVAAYDGEFSAAPRPGGGFRVVARFPLSGVGVVDRLRAEIGPVA